MKRAYRPWAPVILWMAFIFLMSTDAASASHTSRVIEPILRWVKPDISADAIGFVHFLIRKLGHLTEYAVLAILALRAQRRSAGASLAQWSWRAAYTGWAIASAYAVTDELHQAFVNSRTASGGDVMIDSAGALCGLAAVYLVTSLAARAKPASLLAAR